MVRCPVCTKVQLVYMRSPKRTSCYYCGARWIQSGDEQGSVIVQETPQDALQALSQLHPTTEETI